MVAAELSLLRSHGHEVVTYYKNNNSIVGGWQLATSGLKTLWNGETYREFRKLLRKEKPNIVHCHNTFPLISPSIYWACAKENVPVVQTLHNYRLLCLNAFLFRKKNTRDLAWSSPPNPHHPPPTVHRLEICEACLRKSIKWPGIWHKCYRNSRAGSLVVALMLLLHKLIGTWSKKVTTYIVLSEFQKQKMMEGYFPVEKILVKPNFIQIIEKDSHNNAQEGDFNESNESQSDVLTSDSDLTCGKPYALFVGRLSAEKGCDVLIHAWKLFCKKIEHLQGEKINSDDPSSIDNNQLSTRDNRPQLIIVGDGPKRELLQILATSNQQPTAIHFLGHKPKSEVLSLMRNAQFLIFPSIWYETFGLTVVEAGLQKKASLISDQSVVATFVKDRKTGVLFKTGFVNDLANKIEWAFTHPNEMQEMGKKAWQCFDEKYSAKTSYKQLIEIYQSCEATR